MITLGKHINDTTINPLEDEKGFELWLISKTNMEVSMKSVTTQCINGALRVGDLVISTPDNDYSCLVGRVLQINLLGSSEHAEETDNETDDIHVSFVEFDYSKKRIAEIEDMFTELYGNKKLFDECCLDDVIMSPNSLIRITETAECQLKYILNSGYHAAIYCYQILRSLDNHRVHDPIIIERVSDVGCEFFNDTIDFGFKITRIINGETVNIELTCKELLQWAAASLKKDI